MDGSRNNRRLIFSDAKSHCANVTRFANTTLGHFSESSEHSRNSLRRRSTGFLHTLKALINVFNIFQFGISDWTRESREDLLYSQLIICHIVHFSLNLAQWWEFQHWCANTVNVIKTRKHLQ